METDRGQYGPVPVSIMKTSDVTRVGARRRAKGSPPGIKTVMFQLTAMINSALQTQQMATAI